MKTKTKVPCSSCGKYPLEKDEVGASKKLLGTETEQLYCLDCLAAYLDVSCEDIRDKIQMFKEDGCTLFD